MVAGAAERLSLSEQHAAQKAPERLLAGWRREGGALAHGNREMQLAYAVSQGTRQQVIALATGKYRRFNQQHLTEQLGDAFPRPCYSAAGARALAAPFAARISSPP